MIKISVMYPNTANAKFDHDYYRQTHMPLVKDRLGAACSHYSIDKGIGGGAPGSAPTYIAMCHIFSDSVSSFEAGMAKHGAEIIGDVANFTDLTPLMQISEVVVA
ncbi:MAG: ethyl tert-butyl ether degradation protein EthD [Collimonas fungivorans]|uniref:EthD family reductase n=1 Tax=Collimonas fungivorans TaxID=158899 RepID=UPI0026EAE1BF|nr:EthD family reductase [Collimonas fungivorans]MDB5769212.1 ethyl tert-butyl ether degradation protein EthD [Collimonas fungivorans]